MRSRLVAVLLTAFVASVLLLASYSYGFLSHRNRLFPASFVTSAAVAVGLSEGSLPPPSPPTYSTFDYRQDWPPYEHWTQSRNLFDNFSRLQSQTSTVLWIGDSQIELMRVEHYFPNSVNLGVSGNLARVLADEINFIDEWKSEVVVLYIGSNDLGAGFGAEEVFEYYTRIVEYLLGIDKDLVLLGHFLRGYGHDDAYDAKVDQFNVSIKRLADQKRLLFIEFPQTAYDDQRVLRPEYSRGKEAGHLSPDGYRLWTDAIRPRLMPYLTGK